MKENQLRASLVIRGITFSALAKLLGINVTTLYRKIHGPSEFNLAELRKLREILGDEEFEQIFFAPKVT